MPKSSTTGIILSCGETRSLSLLLKEAKREKSLQAIQIESCYSIDCMRVSYPHIFSKTRMDLVQEYLDSYSLNAASILSTLSQLG